uniref:Calreticulin n=1 Tax=Leptobrachium leishanense TaxID=445787 RepID=A0A8C5R729_9ANUR
MSFVCSGRYRLSMGLCGGIVPESHFIFFFSVGVTPGIQTIQDWKFYALSARFEPFSNEGQTLVIQYTVKHEQGIDCGGGYVKLFPADLEQLQMNRESHYYIMFGPDICGTIHEKVHVIFHYKGKHHLIKKNITCVHDELTHLYTLILRPNNTYEVKIDNESAANGTLEDDWDFLPPKKIIDLNATKPLDWDDRERIVDPDDRRPDDWEETELKQDPDSKMPVDWDSNMDGEWEPPMIPNPKYKVKSGTIFDNFLITNNETFAEIVGNETWGMTKDPEREMKEMQDEERDASDEKKQRLKRLHKEFERLDQMEKDKSFDPEKYSIKDMMNRIQGKDVEETKKIEQSKKKGKVQQIEAKKKEEGEKPEEIKREEVEKQEEIKREEREKSDEIKQDHREKQEEIKWEEGEKQEEIKREGAKPEVRDKQEKEEERQEEEEKPDDGKQKVGKKEDPWKQDDHKQEVGGVHVEGGDKQETIHKSRDEL